MQSFLRFLILQRAASASICFGIWVTYYWITYLKCYRVHDLFTYERKLKYRTEKKIYSLGDQWGLGISPIQDITRLGNFYSISTIVISAKTKLLVCRSLISMKCPCFFVYKFGGKLCFPIGEKTELA